MKIATKMMIATFITILITAVSLCSVMYYFHAKTLDLECNEAMARISDRMLSKLNIFLHGCKGNIELLASSIMFTIENYSQPEMTRRFLQYRDFYKCYDSIAVYDLERKCIVDTTGLNIGKENALDGYGLNPIIDKGLVVGVSFSNMLNMPTLYFTYPIKNSDGKVFRIVVSRIPMFKIGEILKSSNKYFFEGHLKIDLIDKDGTLLYSDYNSRGILREKTHCWNAIESRIKSQAEPASFFFEDECKNLVFVSAQPDYLDFQRQGWRLVLSMPLKIVMAPILRLRDRMMIIIVAAIFLTCVIALILSRIISLPIRKLRIASERFAKGDMDYRVSIKSGDEIEDLAGSFNKMAENIKGKEAEILKENAYAEGIISSMIDTLIVINPDGAVRSVNKATCDLLGYTEDELVGKDVSLIFSEEEEEEEEEEEALFKGKRLRRLIEEGSVHDFDMTYKAKSGEKIPVSFSGSVMRDKDDKLVGVIGVAHDMRQIRKMVTDLENLSQGLEKQVLERTEKLSKMQKGTLNILEDLQATKDALEKSKQGFFSIVEKSLDGVIVTDLNGTVCFANPSAARIFRVKREDFIGQSFGTPIVEGEIAEVSIIRQNNETGTGEMRVSRTGWNGRDAHLIIVHDITERKKAEEILSESYKQLKDTQQKLIQSEKESALGRFSLGISHEVKNPLAIILGASDFLDAKLFDSPLDIKENVKMIKRSALRANNILENLLQYMRPSLNKNEDVSLNLLVSEAVKLFKIQSSLVRVDILTELSPKDTRVNVDINQIQQVIFNLVKNSVEACQSGGKVIVKTDSLGGSGIISVIDNGCGMSRETLSGIFEPFFTTKRPGKGTGLGLAISKTIIDNHHGNIMLDSEEGKGTTIKIVLPILKV